MKLPDSLENLIHLLGQLPGVGNKTATRYAMSMANWNQHDLRVVADAVNEVGNLKHCQKCQSFSDDDICGICSNPKRQASETLCIVERISDLMAMENSEQYHGLYHVLGGVLNPLIGIGPTELKIETLIERIQEDGISNVILAINPSVEGDATCSYIKELIPSDISVERIGFGIPMGGSLEYVDSMTISKALENRKSF